jgi:hypothetical protein
MLGFEAKSAAVTRAKWDYDIKMWIQKSGEHVIEIYPLP